jgi:putative glutamine amidotransferase
LEPGSQLAGIYGTNRLDRITTWHGQYVGEPGAGVRITAFAPDGTPEGFEVPASNFLVGVQWHAEMPPWDRQQDALFEAFADALQADIRSRGD